MSIFIRQKQFTFSCRTRQAGIQHTCTSTPRLNIKKKNTRSEHGQAFVMYTTNMSSTRSKTKETRKTETFTCVEVYIVCVGAGCLKESVHTKIISKCEREKRQKKDQANRKVCMKFHCCIKYDCCYRRRGCQEPPLLPVLCIAYDFEIGEIRKHARKRMDDANMLPCSNQPS